MKLLPRRIRTVRKLSEDVADNTIFLEPGHRRHWHPQHLVNAPLREHDGQVWSWMGQESPLMSTEDEPKWVLRKLIEVVEREVKKRGDSKIDKENREETKAKLGVDQKVD